MSVPVGSILEGKVTGITSFGAFVQLKDGPTGLVHISEISDTYVRDINDFLKINDDVKVKVISVKEGKIGLSIKQANPEYLCLWPGFTRMAAAAPVVDLEADRRLKTRS